VLHTHLLGLTLIFLHICVALESARNPLLHSATDREVVLRQEDGSYKLAYDAEDGFRAEIRSKEGVVKGVYGHLDSSGSMVTQTYLSDENGFRLTSFKELGVALPALPYKLHPKAGQRKFPPYTDDEKVKDEEFKGSDEEKDSRKIFADLDYYSEGNNVELLDNKDEEERRNVPVKREDFNEESIEETHNFEIVEDSEDSLLHSVVIHPHGHLDVDAEAVVLDAAHPEEDPGLKHWEEQTPFGALRPPIFQGIFAGSVPVFQQTFHIPDESTFKSRPALNIGLSHDSRIKSAPFVMNYFFNVPRKFSLVRQMR